MNILFPLIILAAAGMVVFALVRGLIAFARTHDAARNGGDIRVMQERQTEMMFARVKWQAIVIVLLIIFGMVAAGAR